MKVRIFRNCRPFTEIPDYLPQSRTYVYGNNVPDDYEGETVLDAVPPQYHTQVSLLLAAANPLPAVYGEYAVLSGVGQIGKFSNHNDGFIFALDGTWREPSEEEIPTGNWHYPKKKLTSK